MKTRRREGRSGINEWGRDCGRADGDHTCRQTGNASLYITKARRHFQSLLHTCSEERQLWEIKLGLIEGQLLASSLASSPQRALTVVPTLPPSLLQPGFILIMLRGLLSLMRIHVSTFKLRPLNQLLLLLQKIGFRFQREVKEQPITAALEKMKDHLLNENVMAVSVCLWAGWYKKLLASFSVCFWS